MLATLPLSILLALLADAQDPLAGQLPKRDLGVEAFLAAHPDYDGRGVRVAVLDTGIDPGHPFLQATPDGRRKIVDWYDATSDGRLALDPVVAEVDGAVMGLSGRRLALGPHAGAGEYRLGRLDAAFLPGELRQRLEEERKRRWEEGRRDFQEARLRRDHAFGDAAPETPRQAEIARRWEEFRDPGPVWDVVVFRAVDGWRVVIDADEDGSLVGERALRPFRDSGDWAVLGDEALLNYAVDVSEDGAELCLFFDTNGHGTHVAGIIGAWQGEGGRLNGIAPGVELVAIKIGDGKYGGSTSGFAIAKALDYAVEAGCQVANMSFGGPSFFADGREPDAWIIEQASLRGLAVVTSAGNEGPTLTTVGAPATARGAFAIAAAVWPDTQRANYAALRPAGPVLFDFSSRGPLPTGDLGVDFVAPGAAISALPSWLITPAENFNGTSMASPQAAGCVALLASAARAEKLPAAPERLRRALRLGAAPLPGAAWFEQGHGAIQVGPALEALRELAADDRPETVWTVEVANPFGLGAGVYERDLPGPAPFERSVRLAPDFPEDAANAAKAAFLRTFRLESEAPWVVAPAAVYASAQGSSFALTIDPGALAPGVHATRVLLWDADRGPSAGPEVIVPVTVVVPVETTAAADHLFRRRLELAPGEMARSFLRVPHGAVAARVRLVQDGAGRNEFRTGAGSVSGFRYAGDRQARGRWFLDHGDSAEQTVPVEAGTVFEYTVVSRWAVNRPARLDLEIEFLGLEPQAGEMFAPPGQDLAYLALKSPLRAERVRASVSIDGIATPILAALAIVPDPIRATVFGGRGMFQGRVEWEEAIPEGGARVTLYTPASIQTTEIREDLMLEIFDANGRVEGRHIAYELETELGQLDAGRHRFRLSFPSLGKEALERRYAGAELRIFGTHPQPKLASDLAAALAGSGGGGELTLPYAGARTLYAVVPELPALAGGRRYFGSVSLRRGEHELLRLPLRIERPLAPPIAAEPAAGEAAPAGGEAAPAAPGAAECAALEALDPSSAEAGERLAKARAWAAAAPLDGLAALAVLRELAAAGMPDFARADAIAFVGRFPALRSAFLAAAPAWNP